MHDNNDVVVNNPYDYEYDNNCDDANCDHDSYYYDELECDFDDYDIDFDLADHDDGDCDDHTIHT